MRTTFAATLGLAALLSHAAGAAEPLPAFPGAEGFGAVSTGGRGGKVIHVTNLNDSGPGSFRAAVAARGPRILVFDVGGTIELDSEVHIQGDNDRITIAGQTAPGGITFIGETLCLPGWQRNKPVRTSDIIVRHIRVRGVHRHSTHSEGGDCLDVYKAKRVIIDHCSFTGSCDETVDACHTQEFTFQWCTIEEPALWGQGNNQHGEGSHNYGFLFSYDAKNLSCHHNLFVHSSNRNPLVSKGVADVRNNVCYHYHIGLAAHGTDKMNFVGNYYKSGTRRRRWISPFYGIKGPGHYFRDNIIDVVGKIAAINDPAKECPKIGGISYRGPDTWLAEPHPVPFRGRTHSAKDAYKVVLARAGAWPRDATTRRCIAEVKARTGSYGLGGPYERFPKQTDGPTCAKFDTDRDGMPDAWEAAHGLDPKDPADGNKVVPRGASKDDRHAGYTFVEFYLNERADGLVAADADLCTVEMKVEGEGYVACGSGGWTVGWHRTATPREVLWGERNTFHNGSTALVKAVPAQGHVFSHWEGGSVDGRKERRLMLTAEKDAEVTAHFVPDPDYGKPVTATRKQGGFTTEVKLFAYPTSANAKVHGDGLAVGRDDKV
jgi:pectate lyase